MTTNLLSRFYSARTCLIVAILFLSPIAAGRAAAAAPPLMSVPGKYAVSATGAFTYSIPVTTPPGTAGMAPILSLDYSS